MRFPACLRLAPVHAALLLTASLLGLPDPAAAQIGAADRVPPSGPEVPAGPVPASNGRVGLGPEDPETLVRSVLAALAARDSSTFTSLVPLPGPRRWFASMAEAETEVIPGIARVVHRADDRAVLALSAHPVTSGSASATLATLGFSGLYEAERGAEGWAVTAVHPLDRSNRILAQALDVTVRPGAGMDVVDTLHVRVGDEAGLALRLNHAVRLGSVRTRERDVDHDFGGGLLWLGLPAGEHRVVLEYAVDVAADSLAHPNSGHFAAAYGHVRNQYLWHPFFDFQSPDQQARFSIRVRAPAAYHVATDLPQREVVEGGVRTVTATAREPTFALSLFYDREWTPAEGRAAGFGLRSFMTPGTPPLTDSLEAVFRRTYELLDDRFGSPKGGYLAVVQDRSREGVGWLYRSNDALAVPEGGGGALSRGGAWPRAWFGHEVAHGWTHPSGAAANFLREGWATFAEALLLEAEYGEEATERFWEVQRMLFLRHAAGGVILEDRRNQGVSYWKGAWIFRMLRDELGAEAFRRGMAEYMEIPPGRSAGHEELVAALSEASGRDVGAYLEPWLAGSDIPDIEVELQEGRLELRQRGGVFPLLIDLELRTPDGPVRRTVRLEGAVTRVSLDDLAGVSGVYLDPDRRLLVKRRRGDTARFVLEGRAEADEVLLEGQFLPEPVAATRNGRGSWTVEVELTEGIYPYRWRVDGERTGLLSYQVEPRHLVGPGVFGR